MKKDFNSTIIKCIDFIERDFTPILVLSHFDADGLISGSLIIKLLYDKNIPFVFRTVNSYSDLKFLEETSFKRIIITDLAYNKYISKLSSSKDVLLIDHHILEGDTDDILVLNPYLFEMNGDVDSSSSILSFMILKTVDESYINFAPIALIGSLEDRQDVEEYRDFRGLNKQVFLEAEEIGLIEKSLGIISYVNFSESFLKCISSMFEPFLINIFNDLEKTKNFLNKCGISKEYYEKKIKDLDTKLQLEFSQKIIGKLLSENFDPYYLGRMFGYNIQLFDYLYIDNLRYLAKIVNFCAKINKYELIIKSMLDEKLNKINLDNYFNEFISSLSKIINMITSSKEKIKEFKNIILINLDNINISKLSSDVANLLLSTNLIKKTVVVVATYLDNEVKFSLRLKDKQKKVNLGEISYKLAEKYKGIGGGHKDSAGLIVSKEYFKEILNELDLSIE